MVGIIQWANDGVTIASDDLEGCGNGRHSVSEEVSAEAWFLGSGPVRGRSPVEGVCLPFIHRYVRPFVPPPSWLPLLVRPGLRPSQQGLAIRTEDKQTYG